MIHSSARIYNFPMHSRKEAREAREGERSLILEELAHLVPGNVYIRKKAKIYDQIGLHPGNLIVVLPPEGALYETLISVEGQKPTLNYEKLVKIEFEVVGYVIHEPLFQEEEHKIHLLSKKKVFIQTDEGVEEREVYETSQNGYRIYNIPHFEGYNWKESLEQDVGGDIKVYKNKNTYKFITTTRELVDKILNFRKKSGR